MKPFRNERGYVLIIVLITIVLISAMALMLIPKAINTSLQVNKNEKYTRAKDLSEMGVEYTLAYLQNQVILAIIDVKNDSTYSTSNHDKLFCEKIKNRLGTTYSKQIMMTDNPAYSFQTGYISAPVTLDASGKTTATCNDFNKMQISISSIGKGEKNSTKNLKANFIIENKGEILTKNTNTPIADPVNLSLVTLPDPVDLSGNYVSKMLSSARFSSPVTIGGNGTLMVGGNAWFEGFSNKLNSVNFNGINGKLIISGNAYFNYPVSFGGNGSNYICIRGDAFLRRKVGTLYTWDKYTEVNNNNYCPPSIQQTIQYYFDINQWFINTDKMEVRYYN